MGSLLVAFRVIELQLDLLDETDSIGERGQAVGQQLLAQRRFGFAFARPVGRSKQQK